MSRLMLHAQPAPSATSSLRPPSDGDSQCCDTPMGGTWPNTSTTPSSKPTAASQARTRHSASLDPVASPIDWVWAYLAKTGEPLSWWLELPSLSPGQVSDVQVQERAKKRAVGFRLPAAQDNKMGWWNTPPCLSSLG